MKSTITTALAIVITLSLGASLWAQVGEPTGFTVTVRQGAATLAQKNVTIGAGGDITDIKINDGTPEGFTQIGTLTGAQGNAPIILKVVTSDDPMFRLISMYIDAPISLQNIYAPGPYSLFNPLNPLPIEVSITNATFAGTAFATPQLVNNFTYLTSFMRDHGGRFYELPQANAFNTYGHGIYDIQVPAVRYLDGSPLAYNFTATPGGAAAWAWSNMANPGPLTTIHDGTNGGQPSDGNGYVFELGMSVAVTGIPEPTTLALLSMGLLAVLRRRR